MTIKPQDPSIWHQTNWNDYDASSRPISEVYIDALRELATPYPSIPLLGYNLFNDAVGGFRMREYSILCGVTGLGKTTLIANWSRRLLLANVKHFVLSVETGDADFVKRTMGMFVGKDINRGDAVPVKVLKEYDDKYGKYFKTDNMYLSIYNTRTPHKKVIDDIAYHVFKKGCKIAFIDNLNYLLPITSDYEKTTELIRVTQAFIDFVKQVEVHVCMVMHPKKTDNGRVNNELDVKGASDAVQEAHNVFLFNPPKDTQKYGFYHRELLFAKVRRRGEYRGRTLIYQSVGSEYQELEII